MPATPIPAGYGIVTHKYTLAGRAAPFVFTHGYKLDNAETADGEAAEVGGFWLANFTAATTLNSYTFVGTHILRNNGGVFEDGDFISSTTGTVNATAVTPAVCVLVQKKSGIAGRKFRGRMYLPPAFLPEANVDNAGIIDGATLTGIQGRATGYLDNLATDVSAMYLLHRDLSTPTGVTSLLVESMVGTQRRRQRGT